MPAGEAAPQRRRPRDSGTISRKGRPQAAFFPSVTPVREPRRETAAHALEAPSPPPVDLRPADDRAPPPCLAAALGHCGRRARILGAIALWAFETGKEIAGLGKDAKAELARLREEVAELREDRDKAQAVANTAESLLKTERVTEERLAEQLRQSESEKLALKADLGFFQTLIPASGGTPEGLAVRGFQARMQAPGHLRFQLLVMQGGRLAPTFNGRYEMTVSGTLDGQPWTLPPTTASQPCR
jgi:hypothetical protein